MTDMTGLDAAAASALRPMLMQLATKALAIAGAFLAAHGLATAAMIIVGVALGALQTRLLHAKAAASVSTSKGS